MKIVYSAGNRFGASVQLHRFLSSIGNSHIVKVAAHLKSSLHTPYINWALDSLYQGYNPTNFAKLHSHFESEELPRISFPLTVQLLDEVLEFEPDLVISDGDPVLANIAKKLEIPLWYCSPLHLLDGIRWRKDDLRYVKRTEALRKYFNLFPKPNRTFIYSPLGDVTPTLEIRKGYEWITPYFEKVERESNPVGITAIVESHVRARDLSPILNALTEPVELYSRQPAESLHLKHKHINDFSNYRKSLSSCKYLLVGGESSYFADAVYNNINVLCSPDLSDYESLLNAILCNRLGVGHNIQQIELMSHYAVDGLERFILNKIVKRVSLKKDSLPNLTQRINEYACSI